jgi:cell division septation protein DedD
MHGENEREFELVLGNKQLLGLLFVTFVLLGVFFALGYSMGLSSVPNPVIDAARNAPETAAANTTRKPTAAGSVPLQPVPGQQVQTPAESAPPPAQQSPTAQAGASAAVTLIDPRPGDTFLQVTAVKRPEADLLAEVLTRKGFKAGLVPAPVENIFRVLVGPVHTDAEQGKLKSDLEQAGFKPIPRRY